MMMRRCSSLALACILTAASLAVAQSKRRSRPPVPRQRPSYTNPVLNADFPDPTVIRAADGLYYAYATQTNRGGRDTNIQVARSADLIAWEHLSDALPAKPAWASGTQKFWAPHVSRHGDTYFMYYSAEPNTKDGLCLAAATSKSPAGPFVDSGVSGGMPPATTQSLPTRRVRTGPSTTRLIRRSRRTTIPAVTAA